MFSIMAVPIYIPTNSVREFPFHYSSSVFVICKLLNDGHSDQCEGTFVVLGYYCSFNFQVSNN